jgi:dTDP-4-amino-4,6-dideoxygalactose transaminase
MISLCHPFITEDMRKAVDATLRTRYIGQGPKVDEFEQAFQKQLDTFPAVAVGSGTDALHIAYELAGIKAGDEVLTPVFTCSAANQTLLHMGAKIVFVDIDEQLNPDPDDIERKITPNTKAIVTVDYAGFPANYSRIKAISDKYRIPLIEDAAHAPGARWRNLPVGAIADFTTFSFQAIKHITTGDGGMITFRNNEEAKKARLLRWFGIDREKKLGNMRHWLGDITLNGYKYQMTDIAASMGIESLKVLRAQLTRRKNLVNLYRKLLPDNMVLPLPEDEERISANWLMTAIVDDRENLANYLYEQGIETSPLHYRNDMYTIFRPFKNDCPNMDKMENKILCLPLNMQTTEEEVETVCNQIKKFYVGS